MSKQKFKVGQSVVYHRPKDGFYQIILLKEASDIGWWYKSLKTGEMLIAENKFLYFTKEEALKAEEKSEKPILGGKNGDN